MSYATRWCKKSSPLTKKLRRNVPHKKLRTLVAELQRIGSHLVWLGTLGLDLGGALGGGTTLYMYCFREREKILDFMEELTGTRFHTNYNLIGGARYDLDAETAGKARVLDNGTTIHRTTPKKMNFRKRPIH